MNKENAREYLPLVEALADGKIIQAKDSGEWFDLGEEVTFSFYPDEYRVKPEPRIWALVRCLNNGYLCQDNGNYPSDEWESITVREVLK